MIEMYDTETEVAHLMALRTLGLIVGFHDATGEEFVMEPEDVDRLRQLRQEGLVMIPRMITRKPRLNRICCFME